MFSHRKIYIVKMSVLSNYINSFKATPVKTLTSYLWMLTNWFYSLYKGNRHRITHNIEEEQSPKTDIIQPHDLL